jgi:hypothetical protein
MKTKLLKRLRKQFELQQRNEKFKVFDNLECLGGIYNQTDFIDKKEAFKIRSKWILNEAQRYLVYKTI